MILIFNFTSKADFSYHLGCFSESTLFWAGFGRSEGQLCLLVSFESRGPSPTWPHFAPLSFAIVNYGVGKITSGESGGHGVPWANGRVAVLPGIWSRQVSRLD